MRQTNVTTHALARVVTYLANFDIMIDTVACIASYYYQMKYYKLTLYSKKCMIEML
jgi:hypothetical protein